MNADHERILEEVLISRVTDGEASARDWSEVERLAERDPALWRRLAEAQRAHAILGRAVEDAIAVADLIDPPADARPGVLASIGRVREYGGWAVAAVLTLAFVVARIDSARRPSNDNADRMIGAGMMLPASMTPDHAWANYIDEGTKTGQVLGEMPAVLVQARPLAGDGSKYEVIVVKSVMAREIVKDPTMFGVQRDDGGRAVLVPERGGFPSTGQQPL